LHFASRLLLDRAWAGAIDSRQHVREHGGVRREAAVADTGDLLEAGAAIEP
jgi:hypothetical protein